MLKKYLDLLSSIYSENGTRFDFSTYLQVLKYTCGLMGVILGILVLIVATIGLPVIFYKNFVSKYKPERFIPDLDVENFDRKAYETHHKKYVFRKIIYFVCLGVFYIPFMIPTVLFLLNIMFGI